MDVHSRIRRAVRFMRRHPGLFVVAGVLASAALVVADRGAAVLPGGTAAGDEPSGEARSADTPERDDEPSRDGAASAGEQVPPGGPDEDRSAAEGGPDGGGGGGGVQPAEGAPTDVAHERQTVDLEQVPAGRDPVRAARWWAAVHAAYVGAEPGSELADRLAPLSTEDLLGELAAVPPAASYQPPLVIEGVSAQDRSGPAQAAGREVWVTVETPTALVIYVLRLEAVGSDTSAATTWLVSEADQL